jgi:Ca2+-transporting ATPase
MCFFTLVASELLVSYPSRTDGFIGVNKELFANKFLNISMALSFVILFAIMYVPILSGLFTIIPLNGSQLGVSAALAAVPVLGSEFTKNIFKKGLCNI